MNDPIVEEVRKTRHEHAKSFGYDGVELACWGDHFDVEKALKDKNYCKGSKCWGNDFY